MPGKEILHRSLALAAVLAVTNPTHLSALLKNLVIRVIALSNGSEFDRRPRTSGDGDQHQKVLAMSRNLNFCTLPLGVRGKSATISKRSGRYCLMTFSRSRN